MEDPSREAFKQDEEATPHNLAKSKENQDDEVIENEHHEEIQNLDVATTNRFLNKNQNMALIENKDEEFPERDTTPGSEIVTETNKVSNVTFTLPDDQSKFQNISETAFQTPVQVAVEAVGYNDSFSESGIEMDPSDGKCVKFSCVIYV